MLCRVDTWVNTTMFYNMNMGPKRIFLRLSICRAYEFLQWKYIAQNRLLQIIKYRACVNDGNAVIEKKRKKLYHSKWWILNNLWVNINRWSNKEIYRRKSCCKSHCEFYITLFLKIGLKKSNLWLILVKTHVKL